jgi:hypothetical protein
MQHYRKLSVQEQVNTFTKIHTMLKNGENPIDKYKDFIYNIHTMSPLIHEKWTHKLNQFLLWKQIMKDMMKERDTEHIKKVINGYNHTFIDFDGKTTTFLCFCGKQRTDNGSIQIIPESEIGDKFYKFMLCNCDNN